MARGLHPGQVGGSMSVSGLPRLSFQGGLLGMRRSSQLCLWGKTSSCQIGGKVTGGFWNFPFNNYMDYLSLKQKHLFSVQYLFNV